MLLEKSFKDWLQMQWDGERELFKLSTKYGELGTTNSRKIPDSD